MTLSGVYRVVEPGRLLVSSETNDDCEARAGGPEAVTTTELEELAGGRCLLVSTLLLATEERRDAMLTSGMDRGLVASYDRLDRLLDELGPERAGGTVRA